MAGMDLPLLEDDLDSAAVIEPSEVIVQVDMPACVVLCFFGEVIESIAARGDARQVKVLVAAHGGHPIAPGRSGGWPRVA